MNAKNRLGFLSFAQTVRPLLYIYLMYNLRTRIASAIFMRRAPSYIYLMYNLRTRIASAIFHAVCYVILHVVLHIIRQSYNKVIISHMIFFIK